MSAIREIQEVVRNLDVRKFEDEFLAKIEIAPVCLSVSEGQFVDMLSPGPGADARIVSARKEKLIVIGDFIQGVASFDLRSIVCGGPFLRSRTRDFPLVVVAFVDESFHFNSKLMSSGSGDRVAEHLRTAVSAVHSAMSLLTALGVNSFIVDRNDGPRSPLGLLALKQCGDSPDERARQPVIWCSKPDHAILSSAALLRSEQI